MLNASYATDRAHTRTLHKETDLLPAVKAAVTQWAKMARYQCVYLIFIRTLKQITAGIISKIRKLKANNIEQRYVVWGVAGDHKKILRNASNAKDRGRDRDRARAR